MTTGQFRGATERTVLTTIALIGLGTALQAVGAGVAVPRLRTLGVVLALVGTSGYSSLLVRRFRQ